LLTRFPPCIQRLTHVTNSLDSSAPRSYISLLQLIAEEFSRADLLSHTRLRLGLTSGLLLGAACMAVLAIWS
jgi:hypothetical protein